MATTNNVFEDRAPAVSTPNKVSDDTIKSFVQSNINNPNAIADAAKANGVSMDDLIRATGFNANEINNYFSTAGVNFGNEAASSGAVVSNQPTGLIADAIDTSSSAGGGGAVVGGDFSGVSGGSTVLANNPTSNATTATATTGASANTALTQTAAPTRKQQILNSFNAGMTDYQIVQKMDEMKFSPQDIAAAYGWNEADVVKNYNLAKEVGGYFAGNQGQDDTTYARKIGTAGWKPEDLARITGANLAEIKSRLGTANKFNTLTDANTALQSKLTTATNAYDTKIGLLNTQYGTLNTSYQDLVKQLAALKAKSSASSSAPSLTTGSGVVSTGVTNTSGLGGTPGASLTGAVYGPDGTAYPGPAAAIAAGVYNYTMFPPSSSGQPKGVTTNTVSTTDEARLSGVTGNYYGGSNQNPDNPWVNLYPTKA